MPIRLTQEDTMGGARRQGYTTTRRGCLSQPDRQVLVKVVKVGGQSPARLVRRMVMRRKLIEWESSAKGGLTEVTSSKDLT